MQQWGGGLSVGSLFSGFGGLDHGLEWAGFRIIWQVEINDYAREIELKRTWPNIPKYGDIREIDWREVASVDILAGGFPCQDISLAGRRTGLSGSRSGLWSEFYRAVRELGPRYVIVENVPAILYAIRRNGRIVEPAPIGKVLGDLAALGYDAEWEIVSACQFGAPHTRERVFILAYPNGERWGRTRWERKSSQTSTCRGTPGGERIQDIPQSSGSSKTQVWPWFSQSPVAPLAYGVSDRYEQITGLGNAVVPQAGEYVGKRLLEIHRRLIDATEQK